jgi:putative oxidoreductase
LTYRARPQRGLTTYGAVSAVARVAQSAVFVGGGRAVWSNPAGPAAGVAPFLSKVRSRVPLLTNVNDEDLVRLNAAVMIGGGLALSTGLATRIGATLLAGSLIPTTIAAFPFWQMPEGPERMHTQSDFLKNAAVWGGLLATLAYAGRSGARQS